MQGQKRLIFSILPLFIFNCSQKEELFTLVDSQISCSIVMDLGSYATAQEAYDDYKNIDWFDNKLMQDNICQTALAALELQQYLSHILNIPKTHLPIIDDNSVPAQGNMIILGLPREADLKKVLKPAKKHWKKSRSASTQALRIDSFYNSNRRGMVLSGRTATGTLYAVYELLSRYGVRWFAPEADSEFIPRMHKIDIFSIHDFVDPEMQIRGFWMDARRQSTQEDIELYRWLGRNRINMFWNREENIAALKQRGILLNSGRQDIFTTLIKPEYGYRYNHPNAQNDDHFPMDPYIISDLFEGDANDDKVLSYEEAHPEWFDVSQDSAIAAVSAPHICLSHTDAVKEFSEITLDKLRYGEWQTCDIIDLWEPQEWCSCEICRQMGNNADKLLYVMYKINQSITKAQEDETLQRPIFLHGYIQKFAAEAPSIKLPKNFNSDNMAVFLFTGPRCYNHYIISPGCTAINIWFSRSLLEWKKEKALYTGDLYIAENYNADYIYNLPATHSEMMRLDIPAYIELGIRGINFQHMRIHNNGVQKLLNYQFSRQSWDKDVAVDTLRDEYFTYYYQNSGELARQYYERLEVAMATISTWGYYLPRRSDMLLKSDNDPHSQMSFIIDERFVAKDSVTGVDFSKLWENTYHNIYEARYLMDQLDSLAASPIIRDRLSDLNRQLEYTELIVNLYDNIISYITSKKDEDYIQEEAIIRMNENKAKLLAMPIETSLAGSTSAYEASGVQHIVDLLNRDFGD